MDNKKIKFDIEDLKNSLLIYDRPPKENEGQFNSVWLDKINNRLYVKDKKEGWKEVITGFGRNIYVSDVSPTPADGENGDLWFEY